jgi:hypothetical protein
MTALQRLSRGSPCFRRGARKHSPLGIHAKAAFSVFSNEHKKGKLSDVLMDSRRISSDKSFVTKNGTRLESLKDFYGHLAIMSEEEFSHHVNAEKNDFASWIEHVHDDRFLAQAVRQEATKEGIRKTIFVAMFR